jgi:hypothetical protein
MTVRAAQDGAESTTSALERAALDWIRPYSQRHHLMRTRDWALELDPGAREALRLAALTHDIERHFPGGLVQDKTGPWDDPAYNRAHAERSARIVGEWLVEQGAERELVAPVEELIRMHETGGSPEADLLQAADSLSFLETLQDIACSWVRDGVCERSTRRRSTAGCSNGSGYRARASSRSPSSRRRSPRSTTSPPV